MTITKYFLIAFAFFQFAMPCTQGQEDGYIYLDGGELVTTHSIEFFGSASWLVEQKSQRSRFDLAVNAKRIILKNHKISRDHFLLGIHRRCNQFVASRLGVLDGVLFLTGAAFAVIVFLS